jgi:hypothetical protein
MAAHTCPHVKEIRPVTPNSEGCEECLATGEPWVAPPALSDVRPRRLLRLLQEQACNQALSRHQPSDHQVARARRELDVLLHRRRDVRGRLGRSPAEQPVLR